MWNMWSKEAEETKEGEVISLRFIPTLQNRGLKAAMESVGISPEGQAGRQETSGFSPRSFILVK